MTLEAAGALIVLFILVSYVAVVGATVLMWFFVTGIWALVSVFTVADIVGGWSGGGSEGGLRDIALYSADWITASGVLYGAILLATYTANVVVAAVADAYNLQDVAVTVNPLVSPLDPYRVAGAIGIVVIGVVCKRMLGSARPERGCAA